MNNIEQHNIALKKTKKIILNAEIGNSKGKSKDCKQIKLDTRVFNKHLKKYPELLKKWEKIQWIDLYELKCFKCKIKLTEKNYKNYNRIKKSKIFSFYKKRYCDKCNKEKTKLARNTLKQKITLIYLSSKRINKNRFGINLDFDKSFLYKLYNKQQGKCYYSKIKMSFDTNNKYKISLDRINSQLPYSKNNIVFSCWIINNMKKNLSSSKFINLCKKVVDNK